MFCEQWGEGGYLSLIRVLGSRDVLPKICLNAQHGALQLFQACRAHILRAGQALPPQPGKGVSACHACAFCMMPAVTSHDGGNADSPSVQACLRC